MHKRNIEQPYSYIDSNGNKLISMEMLPIIFLTFSIILRDKDLSILSSVFQILCLNLWMNWNEKERKLILVYKRKID